MKKYWQSKNASITDETREIINEYLLSLKLENKAEATITKYCSILEQFFTNCTLPVNEVDSDYVLSWIKEFSKDKKATTIDLYLAALSSFFQFCLEEEYLDHVVMKKRWRPKIHQALPHYLTDQEYARVLLAAENLSLRDRSLVLFLFSSGCRRSEMANLNIEDVDLDKRTAEVKGKGGKIRHIHFSEQCCLILKDYLETRGCGPSDPLFMNKFGNRLQTSGIYKVTSKLGKMAGLEKELNPHACRHTFATTMLAKGASLEFIADELGHADLNTTRVYAQVPSEDMILAYQNRMG